MTQIIHNKFVKIEPISHETFFGSENPIYEEIGRVIGKDDSLKEIEIGDTVFFDSWMCKKYPIIGDEDKFHWLVPYDQIVFSERHAPKKISKK